MKERDKFEPPAQPVARTPISKNPRGSLSRPTQAFERFVSQTPQIGSRMPDYVDSNELLAGSGQPQIKPKKKGIFAKLRKK